VSQDIGMEISFVRVMPPLLDDDTGGLVDEDERFVLEEDLERRGTQRQIAVRAGVMCAIVRQCTVLWRTSP